IEAPEARFDDAPLVDATKTYHHDRRDRHGESRALGERRGRALPELELARLPAQHLVNELARLPRERVFELRLGHVTRLDQHVAEEPRGPRRRTAGRRRRILRAANEVVELLFGDETLLEKKSSEPKLVARAARLHEVDESAAHVHGDLAVGVPNRERAGLRFHLQ